MALSLFDRLEGAGTTSVPERLARDVADVLSARRILESSARYRVLAWGLPSLDSITRRSIEHKRRVASYIAETLRAFEPRLRSVRVTPIEEVVEFQFRIEADLVGDDGASVTLRVAVAALGRGARGGGGGARHLAGGDASGLAHRGMAVIDDRLLSAYVAELEALGTHGAEFAREFPDIASELDIASRTSRDPSVERVVESTAFLAARLRLLIESNSAELPVTVLSMLAPVLIEPVPSMAIVGLEGGTEPRALQRGARLDYRMGHESMFCFATTMDTMLAPLRLTVRRAAPMAHALDALSVRLDGEIPSRLYLYLGRNRLSASVLLDAIGKSLVRIELRRPDAPGTAPVAIAPSSLRFHGFSSADRALPDRPGSPRPYRLFTEFVNFEEKFRFISLDLPEAPSGSTLLFHFNRRLSLHDDELGGTFSVNRVPVVNLWPATGTPFDLTGRSLEYPVRVDARRYRIVETHSVERVDLFQASGGSALNIDPLVAASRRSEAPSSGGSGGRSRARARRSTSTSGGSTTSTSGATGSWSRPGCSPATGRSRKGRARAPSSSPRRASRTGARGFSPSRRPTGPRSSTPRRCACSRATSRARSGASP